MKKMVLFDFDGVIADSYAISFATTRYFNPTISEEVYRTWFEGNINSRMDDEADHIRREGRRKAEVEFFNRYRPLLLERPLFDRIDEVIRALAGKYTMIVVSSTVSDVIDAYLVKYGIRDCFKEILGNDVDRSKERKIAMALERYAVAPADAVMVTDTLGDIREARKAGVESIAVTWGFHEPERLAIGEPLAIVSTPQQLAEAIVTAV